MLHGGVPSVIALLLSTHSLMIMQLLADEKRLH